MSMVSWKPHNPKNKFKQKDDMIYVSFYVAHFDVISNSACGLNFDHIIPFKVLFILQQR